MLCCANYIDTVKRKDNGNFTLYTDVEVTEFNLWV